MANSEINNYITERYYRWLDYAMFHCGKTSMSEDATDVLNEVLASLLQKDTDKLYGLLHRPKDGYTELDWYVLRMIKINIKSPTSPYQQKMRHNKMLDSNVDILTLQIEDITEGSDDKPSRILKQMNTVREVLDDLGITDDCKAIFSFHFFQGESFADWPGKENIRKLYNVYNQVMDLVKGKINGEIIF